MLRLIHILYILVRFRILHTVCTKYPFKFLNCLYFIIPANKSRDLPIGKKVAQAFEVLGTRFIKLGQSLSARPDIVGDEVARDLAGLQDSLEPFSNDQAVSIIESETGQKITELFTSFDMIPVASASIAQVYKGTLSSGEEVALKVLRPNIKQQVTNDIKFFLWLSRFIEKHILKHDRLQLEAAIKMIRDNIKMETNLKMEAAAFSEMKDNFDDNHLYIPKVYWQYTTQQIMITEWIHGIKIGDIDKLKNENYNLKKISSNLAISFFNQAYRDGFFHADLHPGNLFVLQDHRIAMVDFGIVGRLDYESRLYVAEIFKSFIDRDYRRVAEIHAKAGYIQNNQDIAIFAQAIRSVIEPAVGKKVAHISTGQVISSFFKVTRDFNMCIQTQLLLLQKTILLMEGIGGMVDKEFNIWQLAEPWIEEWAVDNLGIERKICNEFKNIYDSIINHKNDKPSTNTTPSLSPQRYPGISLSGILGIISISCITSFLSILLFIILIDQY